MATRTVRSALRFSAFLSIAVLGASLAPACGGDSDVATGPPGPSGSDCTVNGQQCQVVCDADLGCVDCITDDDCGAAAPECVNGECEECSVAADCGPGESCFPRNHECERSCADNGDCDGDEPLCDTATGACVGCLDANDCDGNEPLCSATTQQCVECETSGDCGAAEPYCDDNGRCRECLVDGNCGAGEVCNDRECRGGCVDDEDCPNDNPFCDERAECVECLRNDHCGAASPICDNRGECVECTDNEHCTDPDLSRCDEDNCVECIDDEHCEQGFQCNDGECQPN